MDLKKVLEKIKVIVMDMDGTVNIGYSGIGDMAGTLAAMREAGKQLVFLTNNSSRSRKSCAEQYSEMGLYDPRDTYYTSGAATIEYIKDHYPNKTCLVVGTDALVEEFKESGIEVVDSDPNVAVLGLDTGITYAKIVSLISAINNGAVYIATHPDYACPAEDVYIPDCGAFIKLVELSSGRKPVAVIGKPAKTMGEYIMAQFGCNADEIMMIGDRLETDIEFGINCSFYTLAVLTGATTEQTLKESSVVPDFVLPSLNDIVPYLK